MAETTTASATEDISDVLRRFSTQSERVILVRDGEEVAAVVPLADVRRLEAIEAEEDEIDATVFDQAREDFAHGRTVSHADVKRRLGFTG
jgi:hypothetical protein